MLICAGRHRHDRTAGSARRGRHAGASPSASRESPHERATPRCSASASRARCAAARPDAGWLAGCLAITLCSHRGLVVGTSSIATSLGWLCRPSPVLACPVADPPAAHRRCVVCGRPARPRRRDRAGVFRNRLAEPYLLGTASGAALGVTLSLLAADASIADLPGPARSASRLPPASAPARRSR